MNRCVLRDSFNNLILAERHYVQTLLAANESGQDEIRIRGIHHFVKICIIIAGIVSLIAVATGYFGLTGFFWGVIFMIAGIGAHYNKSISENYLEASRDLKFKISRALVALINQYNWIGARCLEIYYASHASDDDRTAILAFFFLAENVYDQVPDIGVTNDNETNGNRIPPMASTLREKGDQLLRGQTWPISPNEIFDVIHESIHRQEGLEGLDPQEYPHTRTETESAANPSFGSSQDEDESLKTSGYTIVDIWEGLKAGLKQTCDLLSNPRAILEAVENFTSGILGFHGRNGLECALGQLVGVGLVGVGIGLLTLAGPVFLVIGGIVSVVGLAVIGTCTYIARIFRKSARLFHNLIEACDKTSDKLRKAQEFIHSHKKNVFKTCLKGIFLIWITSYGLMTLIPTWWSLLICNNFAISSVLGWCAFILWGLVYRRSIRTVLVNIKEGLTPMGKCLEKLGIGDLDEGLVEFKKTHVKLMSLKTGHDLNLPAKYSILIPLIPIYSEFIQMLKVISLQFVNLGDELTAGYFFQDVPLVRSIISKKLVELEFLRTVPLKCREYYTILHDFAQRPYFWIKMLSAGMFAIFLIWVMFTALLILSGIVRFFLMIGLLTGIVVSLCMYIEPIVQWVVDTIHGFEDQILGIKKCIIDCQKLCDDYEAEVAEE